ncbi:MAG: heme ABC transporter ATP-binding protein [Pseudolabrys sp.]|nr:heme ABC transporter ATP-binding protein [Pseudolabrys sp.]
MMRTIEALSLCVSAGPRQLLDDVSLSALPGETIALVGPNGAGKSTLLRTLAGEIVPSRGRVRLKGRDLRACRADLLARQRAVLPQSVATAFPFTVREIVGMSLDGLGVRTAGAWVEAALAEVDLDGFQDRSIDRLSIGERQRVHFARVLVQLAYGESREGPGLLLLDEPTSSLDLKHQLGVIAAARRRAANGTTVIAVLHDFNLAALFARRVIVLRNGRTIADGPPPQTITDSVLGETFGVFSAVNRVPTGATPFVLPQTAVLTP